MSETMKQEEKFIGYEYKDVTVRRDTEALYADSYTSFGWTPEGTTPSLSPTSVTLKFKRNRRIKNKAELTRLQREFESHIREIEKLEDSKGLFSSAIAYGVGILGAAFMAGSVFAITAATPLIVWCIILAVPGCIGWILPYFLSKKIRQNKTEQVTPLIDRKYDEIYETCEKADRLVHC